MMPKQTVKDLRQAKIFRNFSTERDRLHAERIAAYGEYIADVKDGAFPEAGHTVPMAEEDFEAFVNKIG